MKNKRRISIFAGYSTPDISFFKTAIKDQKGIEINEYIQKLGSDFYNTPSEKDLAETELFVFIAFPVNTTPDLLLEQIKKQLALGKPILFIGGLKTDYQKLKKIEDFLPFITASSQSREFEVLPDFYPQSLSNSLLRIDGTDNDLEKWNKLTPIFRTETFVRVKPESEIIAGIKINNTPLKEPLIVTRDLQSKKSLAVLGYGLYRWKLTGYAEEISKQRNSVHDLYQIFITNAIRWLSVSEQSRRIRIQPIKDFFSVDEPIEFIAQIYDAAYTPIDDANVVVKIETKDGIREQVFSQISNGRYFASFDNLGKGDFKFSGKAEKNDKNIGNDEGRFSIGGLNAEYRDLVMNYNLLSNIAKYTNGKFYFSDDVSNILKDVKGDPNFKPLINTSRFDYLIWNNAWLMALAIMLLSLEWFLRKRAGLL